MSIIAEVNQCRNCGKDLTAQTMPFCSDCAFNNKLNNNNIESMNTIKKGDEVYHYKFEEKGVVESRNGIAVAVRFQSYGVLHVNEETLSFKPYTLEGGGFSQERPKPEMLSFLRTAIDERIKDNYFEDDAEKYISTHGNEKGRCSDDIIFGFNLAKEYSLENPLI